MYNPKEKSQKELENDFYEALKAALGPLAELLGVRPTDYEDKVIECKVGDYVGIMSDRYLLPAKVIDVNLKTISIAPLRFSLDPNNGELVEEGADLNNVKTYVYNEHGSVKTLSDLDLVLLDE